VHTLVLPKGYGRPAYWGATNSLKVMSGAGARKIITNVPEYNTIALRFAQKCGMTIEGINRLSFLKNGKLCNQIVLGITEGEIKCLSQH
jgi:hypothetical protein